MTCHARVTRTVTLLVTQTVTLRVTQVVTPIVTDPGKMRQILINLIGNAIKFTNEGEVRVTVEADAATRRPISIAVRDTGIGIPADRLQKVFEPFEQGDSSTRREFGGTGLGLSIVKAFAELIGAAVEVESEPGQGTTFTVWLPDEGVGSTEAATVGAGAKVGWGEGMR